MSAVKRFMGVETPDLLVEMYPKWVRKEVVSGIASFFTVEFLKLVVKAITPK